MYLSLPEVQKHWMFVGKSCGTGHQWFQSNPREQRYPVAGRQKESHQISQEYAWFPKINLPSRIRYVYMYKFQTFVQL